MFCGRGGGKQQENKQHIFRNFGKSTMTFRETGEEIQLQLDDEALRGNNLLLFWFQMTARESFRTVVASTGAR